MLEPLTFYVSLPGAEWISMQVSPAEAVRRFRDGGYVIQPRRPIVAEDFADFSQRCDLGVLGYSSRDFRPPMYEHKPCVSVDERDQVLWDAYASLGLDRVAEYGRLGKITRGLNGIRTEIYQERVNALDKAVLEVYHRRAVI